MTSKEQKRLYINCGVALIFDYRVTTILPICAFDSK
jgi:hypothetical protein